jgi:hypothetical protein
MGIQPLLAPKAQTVPRRAAAGLQKKGIRKEADNLKRPMLWPGQNRCAEFVGMRFFRPAGWQYFSLAFEPDKDRIICKPAK